MKVALSKFFGFAVIFFTVNIQSAEASNKWINYLDEGQFTAPHFLYNHLSDSAIVDDTTDYKEPKNRKLKAVILCVLLGHFGVHRIYLGTKANVPVAYSLTLGGGLGLLPLLDAIAIIKSDNLDEFSNNDRVIMWSKPRLTQP